MAKKAFGSASLIFGDDDETSLTRARRVIGLTAMLLIVGLIWSWFAKLDEVATGTAKVVPSLREQVIQSLEGGILAELAVQPDQVVQPNQILARLDPTRNEAEAEESTSRYRALQASAQRLAAEISGEALVFPAELEGHAELIASERQLFEERKTSLQKKIEMIDQSLEMNAVELDLNLALQKTGATSRMDVLRLERERLDLEMNRAETLSEYRVKARQDLSQIESEMAQLRPVVRSREDVVTRLTLRSPVYGIVKNIEISTIGGVVPPNGKLMDIVPLDDKLMIEARITPRDIAFIRPGLAAKVKISAYDYAQYGGLDGKVESISADTIQDESDPKSFYYRVVIRTESDVLINKNGESFPIVPGMMATVDIHTGQKTIFDYLIKPFNNAAEAMRER